MRIRDRAFQGIFARTFVYNILFEDAEVDEQWLGIDEDATVLSITGAGCGVAGLLSRRPRQIDAVDLNRHHLALAALKCTAAVHTTSYGDFYDLLGRGWSPDPQQRLRALTASLPPWLAAYWRGHSRRFDRSLYLHGLTADLLARVRRNAGITVEWARAMAGLSVEQRVDRLRQTLAPLDTRRTRALLGSPLTLVALGINDTQRDRLVRTESRGIVDFFVEHLTRVMHTDLATNWFFWWAAAGQFDHDNPLAVPPYLRRDRWEQSRGAPTRIRYRHTNVFAALADAGPATWSHYTLCDAPDWMPLERQRTLFREIRRTGRPGAIVLLRSVDADDPVERAGAGRWLEKLPCSDDATAADRSRQYRQVNLYRLSA
jgi:S-adenosylmethionine-diacylglycerol 3-amino-3-carboxypropyl transferase